MRETTEAYESYLTVDVVRAFEAFVEDLSNWYIRRSRRRFWDGDAVAFATLWYALVQGLRVVAPLMPFLTDHLWRTLAAPVRGRARRRSTSPAGRGRPSRMTALLAEVAELRRVVELGRQARVLGRASRSASRSARSSWRARRSREGHSGEIAEELRVQDVVFGAVDASELRVKPHLPVLGPKLGKELAAVRSALEAGDFEALPDGGFRVAGHELASDEVLVERRGQGGLGGRRLGRRHGRARRPPRRRARLLGRVYELIHRVNSLRKEAGLELTDRIELTLPESDSALLEHSRVDRARDARGLGRRGRLRARDRRRLGEGLRQRGVFSVHGALPAVRR